jgi:hypothetical protein
MVTNRKKKPRSVSATLAGWLALSAVFVSAAIISINFLIASRNVRALLEEKADDYVSVIAASLEKPLRDMDPEGIKKAAAIHCRNDSILMLRVVSPDYKPIFEFDRSRGADILKRKGRVPKDGKLLAHLDMGFSCDPYE